ncbi:hypothetical protein ACG7TL_008949 [Trametes sanguinea]
MILPESASDPFIDQVDRPPSPTDTLLPDYVTEANIPPPNLPPNYALTQRPTRPRIYTFSSWNHDSMFLLPPNDVDRTLTPVYNISVALNLNPFVPLSYVTTIRRGIDEDGEFVGEFELAVMQSRAIVKLGDHSTRMSNVLKKDGYSPVGA